MRPLRARSMPCAARLVTRYGRREVGVDHRGEVVLAHPQQQAVVGDAGVRHEHLDRAPELGLDRGERGVDLGAVA